MGDKYVTAVELARAELQKADPAEIARKAGADYQDGELTMVVCGRPVALKWATGELRHGDDGQVIDTIWAVPVLHYLLQATGNDSAGELLPYRDLWGANLQSGPFIDRPEKQLIDAYTQSPEGVLANARRLGAAIIGRDGDYRVDIRVFPKVPVTVLLYAPDDDFQAGAKILFDSVIREYLPTEDTVAVADRVAEELTKPVD